MNNYETLFVIKPTLTDEETQAQIAKVKEILENEDAEVLAINQMGMRRLAYPIDKNERAFYALIYFRAKGSVIAELERKLKFNEDILKYLTVKYTKQKELAQFNKLVSNATSTKKEEKPQEKEEPKVEAQEEPKAEESSTATADSTEA